MSGWDWTVNCFSKWWARTGEAKSSRAAQLPVKRQESLENSEQAREPLSWSCITVPRYLPPRPRDLPSAGKRCTGSRASFHFEDPDARLFHTEKSCCQQWRG